MISHHFEWAKSMAIILTVTLELIFRKNADNKMWCGVYICLITLVTSLM